MTEPPGLALEGVCAGYGDTVIVEGVALDLPPGGTLAVLGRNGVGKTTLLATIMGHTRLHGGRIRFGGREISNLPPYRRARLGIGFVPQEREIFPSLTVEENLLVAKRPGKWSLARVYDFFPSLAERRRNRGHQLSGGEQQMLAIARGLMARPRLLLLDEPTLGLAPIIVEEIELAIGRLAGRGMTILLAEQNAAMVMRVAHRVYVLKSGRISLEGTPADLAKSPEIQRLYLGT